MNDNKIMIKIKYAHTLEINEFKNYLYKNNKKDLLLLISYSLEYVDYSEIRLWDVNTWECLYNYDYRKEEQVLWSINLLFDNYEYYLLQKSYIKPYII